MKMSELQSFLDAFQLTQSIVCEECRTKIQELLTNPFICKKVSILQRSFDVFIEKFIPQKEQRIQSLRESIMNYMKEKELVEERIKEVKQEIKALTS